MLADRGVQAPRMQHQCMVISIHPTRELFRSIPDTLKPGISLRAPVVNILVELT